MTSTGIDGILATIVEEVEDEVAADVWVDSASGSMLETSEAVTAVVNGVLDGLGSSVADSEH